MILSFSYEVHFGSEKNNRVEKGYVEFVLVFLLSHYSLLSVYPNQAIWPVGQSTATLTGFGRVDRCCVVHLLIYSSIRGVAVSPQRMTLYVDNYLNGFLAQTCFPDMPWAPVYFAGSMGW